MKKLFIGVLLLTASCVTSNQEKDIRIYYQDGSVEDLTISTEHGYSDQIGGREATIYFHEGCLYRSHQETKYDANFTGCIRCGVKNYEVLEIRNIKIKEDGE